VSLRTILVRTDASGDFAYQRRLKARIYAIEIQLEELETPDVDIFDSIYGTSFLSVDALAADTVYQPGSFLQDDAGDPLEIFTNHEKAATPAVCMGMFNVVIAGGGDEKRGRIYVLYEGGFSL